MVCERIIDLKFEGGDGLEDVLQKMDPDKRERLINSALKEFGNNTYEKASTNTIVKEAGISKGLLYHYFDSKESLYEYLITFFFEKTTHEVIKSINIEEQDILERIGQTAELKIELVNQHPSIMDFAKAFYMNKRIEDMKQLFEKYSPNFYHDFYHKNIDYGLFKEDVDIGKALNIVQWTVEKFTESKLSGLMGVNDFDMESLHDELKIYIEMMKKAFYK